MKKIRYIGLLIGFIFLFSSNSKAQYYYTSYGYAQDWYLPQHVQYNIYDNYYGYEIAHVKRHHKHGYQHYNVLLHRNGWYVELRFNQHGHIYKTIRHRYNYPLMSHHCTGHCGYHKTYYRTYYPKYHHTTTVYVNSHGKHYNKHHKSNNYYTNIYVEKQQNKKSNYQGNNQGRRQNNSIQQNTTRSSQPKVIRKPQQRSHQKVEQSRPTQNNSRMRQAQAQQVTRQNTSRGATRSARSQSSGRSQRNR